MSNQRKKPASDLLHVATLGRTVGLRGDMKFHDKSDFPEQFTAGATFFKEDGTTLVLAEVNEERGTVRVAGCDSPEAAKKLTNVKLFTTKEATRELCELEEGEFFWFDIVGSAVFDDDGRRLGSVAEIDRIGEQDYLSITTDAVLVEQGLSKSFLIPYQDPFIVATDVAAKRIDVRGGMDILEAS